MGRYIDTYLEREKDTGVRSRYIDMQIKYLTP